MPGSFDYTPQSGVLANIPCAIGVFRYDSSQQPPKCYSYLPNVYCEQIQYKEGPEPPTVQFRYILDDSVSDASEGDPEDPDETYPSQFEELWPLESPSSDYKVETGDRLVVLEQDPEGNYRVLWDGFAQVPQVDLSPDAQQVTFVGAGVAVRLWDNVIGGRYQRDGSEPTKAGTDNSQVTTDLPTRFNPADPRNAAGMANCTPDDADETLENGEDDQAGDEYPLFLDPDLPTDQDEGQPYQTYWTLGKAVRYLLALYNTGTDPDSSQQDLWVDNPDFNVLDALLENYQPTGDFYDPNDPSTYTTNPINIRDYDATNKPFPEVLWDLLAPNNFRFRFITEGNPPQSGGSGPIIETPYTYIDFYRFDAQGPTDPKQLSLPVSRSNLDPATCNLSSLSAVQDVNGLANQWEVETEPIRYEVSIVLAPGFQPQVGDSSASNRKDYLLSNLDDASGTTRDKYRLYIANEAGQDGYYSIEQQAWQDQGTSGNQAIDFTNVFNPKDSREPQDQTPNYVERYRPGARKLLSLDPSKNPYTAQLAVSRDYGQNAGGDPPIVWNGTGTWQIIQGGWQLLRDKLGVYVNIEDPESWDIGKPGPSETAVEPSGVLHGITCICNPGTYTPPNQVSQAQFWLRLTTVIDGDHCLDAVADMRPASPFPYTITRRIDAKDHFKKEIIDKSSCFNTTGGASVSRDDSTAALTYAYQLRAAHEFPPLAAAATIPWFTKSYDVSDRIDQITGRNADLRTNAGAEQGEGAYYPYVVGVTWDFRGDGQRTILQLQDRRTEPQAP